MQKFEFRVLRENRRVEHDESRKEAIEEFHAVLGDVSLGYCSEAVKKYIVQSYVRGARFNNAETCPLEKVTSVGVTITIAFPAGDLITKAIHTHDVYTPRTNSIAFYKRSPLPVMTSSWCLRSDDIATLGTGL